METKSTSVITTVSSYSETSMATTHQLLVGSDGIVTGEIYTFKFSWHSSRGWSDWSLGTWVSPVDAPTAPNSPTVNRQMSSTNSLYLSWVAVADGVGDGGVITGYELQIDDQGQGNYATIMYGVGQPQRTYFLATNLSGKLYNVRVRAYNFNGPSSWSTSATFNMWTLPSGFADPVITATTSTTITVQWTPPTSDGGWPILGYAVFIDDGHSGSFVEANMDSDPSVRNQPNLNELIITRIASGSAGLRFRIKVQVFNDIGKTDSKIVSTILCSVPDAPPIPVFVASGSSSSKITISIGGLDTSNVWNTNILSYEIQYSDDCSDNYISLVGATSPFTASTYTISSGISKGSKYKFKYRASNIHGFSDFSPELTALAADAPQAPPKPQLTSVDSSYITLALSPSDDNGGSVITSYALWINSGSYSSTWRQISTAQTKWMNLLLGVILWFGVNIQSTQPFSSSTHSFWAFNVLSACLLE